MTKIIGSGDSMLDLLGDPVDTQPGKRKRHATAAIGSAAPKPQGFVDQLVAERTVFSDDRTHRFTLFRYWGDPDDYVCGINMNPSGAAEIEGDATVDAMCRRAKDLWGAGAYWQLNCMSIRGTYSKDLDRSEVLNLPENDEWIRKIAPKARMVVVGWGNPGHRSGRGPEVERLLREVCDPSKVFCFGRNKNMSPVHPLFIRHDAPLQRFFD